VAPQLGQVFWHAPRQQAAVDRRMQSLDSPAQDLGKARDAFHALHRQPRRRQGPCGSPGREQSPAALGQALSEWDEASLVGHAQ